MDAGRDGGDNQHEGEAHHHPVLEQPHNQEEQMLSYLTVKFVTSNKNVRKPTDMRTVC